jgi:hypothetical protein
MTDTMQDIFVLLTFGGLVAIWLEIKRQGDD